MLNISFTVLNYLFWKLAQLPTPVHRWNIPEIPTGCEIYIKRDDVTGNTFSGNKVKYMNSLNQTIVVEIINLIIK